MLKENSDVYKIGGGKMVAPDYPQKYVALSEKEVNAKSMFQPVQTKGTEREL